MPSSLNLKGGVKVLAVFSPAAVARNAIAFGGRKESGHKAGALT